MIFFLVVLFLGVLGLGAIAVRAQTRRPPPPAERTPGDASTESVISTLPAGGIKGQLCPVGSVPFQIQCLCFQSPCVCPSRCINIVAPKIPFVPGGGQVVIPFGDASASTFTSPTPIPVSEPTKLSPLRLIIPDAPKFFDEGFLGS